MSNLEQKIGYTFKNKDLLRTALTHSSYSNEKKLPGGSNERLEFLGDAVLSIVVSEHLFRNLDQSPEGELTKLRASLVCEKSLCGFAREINLGQELKLGRGEQHTGGRERPSILADAFEALIAAVFIDGSLAEAKKFVLRFVEPELENQNKIAFQDYKTNLQEIIQQNPEEHLEYQLVEENGPDHNKSFTVNVLLNSNIIGTGSGKSKKEAEQNAAREALKLMGI